MERRILIPEAPDYFESVPFSYTLHYADLLEQSRRKKKPDPKTLKSKPVYIHISGMPDAKAHYAPDGSALGRRFEAPELEAGQDLTDGRYFTEIGTAHIEAFLKKGSRDYLYVFLDGGRTRNQGKDLAPLPSFLRWSWYPYTSASILCLEDPMFYTYKDVSVGWFYGTEDEDYVEYCAAFVRYVAEKLAVPYRHIILYGPSGGGRAAVSMTRFIPESTAAAINGQYDVRFYDYYKKGGFTEATHLTISEEDPLKRCDMAEVIRGHKENKYLLICNIRSACDFKEQLKALCEKLSITPGYGIRSFGNVSVWLISAVGIPSAHSVWENPLQFQMIDILLENLIRGAKAQDFDFYCQIINDYWNERYEFQKQLTDLESGSPINQAYHFFKKGIRKFIH